MRYRPAGPLAPLLAAAAALALAAPVALTQTQGKAGYWVNPSSDLVWKNAVGQCWRAGYWTPAHAIMECDPDLLPKPAAVVPPVAQAPAPKPAPAPAPSVQKLTLAADALFDFDKAVLKPEGRAKLDELLASQTQVDSISAVGHTDSIGSDAYNQRLSQRRAEAVKTYLVGKGVPAERIRTDGKGEKQPVADNRTRDGRALNRRVEIEITGTRAQR